MSSRSSLALLFFALLVAMLGFGIIIPLLPFLVEKFGGGGMSMGLLMAIFSVMQFAFSSFWGALSDRYGRKPILILGTAGNAITMFGFGFSASLGWLYFFRALGGLFSSAVTPVAMAFIADSTDDQARSSGMGLTGAAFGTGMVLGPGLGGMLGGYSLRAPFLLAGWLSLFSALLIALLLPESLSPARRRPTPVCGPQFRELFQALHSPIGFLLILAFLHNFALTNFEGIFAYYTAQRYHFSPQTVGIVTTTVGLSSAIVQGILTGPFSRRWGDVKVVKASLFASIFGFSLMLLARNLLEVILTSNLFIFTNAMLRPGVATLISRRAQQGQGIAMGLNNAWMSLGRIVGPLWAGSMLELNLNYPFLSGALLMLIAFLAARKWLPEENQASNT
jgi:DHA1 family multidrug resistance protein-like MFS transporter